jgi:universal stress protein A
MFRPHLILHPTDFSDCSRWAASIAADLAQRHDALVLVLHVVETLGPENVTYGEAVSQRQPEGYRQRLDLDLRRSVPLPGVMVEYLLAEGDPATEIDRVARERGCDLIVLGTHGRKGLAHLLMGSVAEEVVRRALCPVLIVRTPGPPDQAASAAGETFRERE